MTGEISNRKGLLHVAIDTRKNQAKKCVLNKF